MAHSAQQVTVAGRTTKQRVAVVEALTALHRFAPVKTIHEQIAAAGRSVGLTTVYRTLEALAKQNQVDTIHTPDGEALYRLCSTSTHHHHLVCTNCGKTVEITDSPVEAWAKAVAEDHGFHMSGHSAEVYGLCEDCYAG